MNKVLVKPMLNYFLIIIAYISYTMFITGLPVDQTLLGGDWSFPATKSQLNQWLETASYTWYGVNFGSRNLGLTPLPLIYIEKFFTIFVTPAQFISSFLMLSIAFMGINLYALLRFFNTHKTASFIAGICYMSSPIVYNYTIMGWVYILLAMTFLPLAIKYFIKSVQEDKIYNIFLVTMLISISLQIHTIVWFLIIASALSLYLIKKNRVFIYFKYIFVLIILFAMVNAYFLFNLFVLPDQSIVSNDIINSNVSIGAASNFSLHNILRLFGATHNYQYEYIIEQSSFLIFSSYFGTITILYGYFITQNKRLYLSFLLILLVPFLMYLLSFNRDLLSYIPFSNVFRDFGRITVLSSLASGILIGVSVDGILRCSNKLKVVGIVILSIYFVSFYPWYSGQLLNWKQGLGKHQSLRTKVFSQDYLNVENLLLSLKKDAKVLYLPHSSYNDFNDDIKFSGSYNEAQDIFAYFSPMTGPILLSDRNLGYGDNFSRLILNELSNDFFQLLSLSDINYIVVRKNLKFPDKTNVLIRLEAEVQKNKILEVYNTNDILVYEINNPTPHIFAASEKIKFKNFNNSIYPDFDSLNHTISLYASDSVDYSEEFNGINSFKSPNVEYIKINPTKYKVIIDDASDNFMLIFLDSFHELWKVYIKPIGSGKVKYNETWVYDEVSSKKHFIINSYSNSWLINSKDICSIKNNCSNNKDATYNFELIIEFYPQKYYYYGLFISLGTLLIFLLYALYFRFKLYSRTM